MEAEEEAAPSPPSLTVKVAREPCRQIPYVAHAYVYSFLTAIPDLALATRDRRRIRLSSQAPERCDAVVALTC